MLVQLHCGGYSIGLQLPASPADVQQKLNTLRNGSEQNAPISIRDVNEPLSYLRQYIQNVDLTSGPELEKLNRLSEKVDGMSAQEQHILWGPWTLRALTAWMMFSALLPVWASTSLWRASLLISNWAAGWWSMGWRGSTFPKKCGPT